MITIAGRAPDIAALAEGYPENSIERNLLTAMNDSGDRFTYDSPEQLHFELRMRKETVNAAYAQNRSGLRFATFTDSRCNPAYWERTPSGGFLLKEGVSPGKAVRDLYENGRAYATECATAMVMVYYMALLEVFGDEAFDRLFPSIYLMDWDVREPLLSGIGYPLPVSALLVGDRGYFRNPDVNPVTPQWQGENVIVMPGELFYGHGVGIQKAEGVIRALNNNRKEGSETSAYLMDQAARPNYKKLHAAYVAQTARTAEPPQAAQPVRPAATDRVLPVSALSGPVEHLVWRDFPEPLRRRV